MNLQNPLHGAVRVLTIAWCITIAGAGALAQSSTDAFSFDLDRIRAGTLYHYEKSNIDGTHRSNVSLYIASINRIEALKWSYDSDGATLVIAAMDWETFSVRRFESWRVDVDGKLQQVATLDAVKGTRDVVTYFAGSSDTVTIHHEPWHSYDFDFASLNFSLRHLRDAEADLTIGIADIEFLDGFPQFRDKGTVVLHFVQDERREGTVCRKYTINGPGLQDRGGHMWVSKEGGHIVDFEIDLPDEPGHESGKLRLKRIDSMSREEWSAFVHGER